MVQVVALSDYFTRAGSSFPMSIKCMNAVWRIEISPPLKKLVLMALADFANDEDGYCWPGITTIAKKCGCSDRSVQMHISELVEDGLLRIYRRDYQSSIYQVAIAPGETVSPGVKDFHPSGETVSPSPVNFFHHPGEEFSPRSIIDPSVLDPSILTLTPLEAPDTRNTERSRSNGLLLEKQAEEIYSAYPKKVARPSAIKAIKKAVAQFGYEFILQKTKSYAQVRAGQDVQFTPHPATWFNGHRFNDDPATWALSTAFQPRRMKQHANL